MPENAINFHQKDDWDGHWNLFAKGAALNPAQQMRYGLIDRIIKKEMRLGEEVRVCDIGSGQGDLISRLSCSIPTGQFVGLELSTSGVEISRSKAPASRFYVENVFTGNPDSIGLSSWATHAVCSEVLEHVDNPVAFLRAARAYLSPGAVIILTVPGGPMSQFDKYIGHRQHFNRQKITSVLEEAGFQTKRVILAGFPFFNLYRLTVILSGKHLANAIRSDRTSQMSLAARLAMKFYNILFSLNLSNFAMGWQVVAIAIKKE